MGAQRREDILWQVRRHGYLGAAELAREFGVDTSTIRRDLRALEERGLVIRRHGGVQAAERPAETPYLLKAAAHTLEKDAIGAHLANLIGENSSVLLDSGSTTYAVANAMRDVPGLTVITYDLRVAMVLADRANVRLIVIGGEAQLDGYSLFSQRAADQIGEFSVDYAVLAADAVDPGWITNVSSYVAPLKRALLSAARQKVFAADSSKFDRAALVRVTETNTVDLIVTDVHLSEERAAAYPVPVTRVAVPDAAGPVEEAPYVSRH